MTQITHYKAIFAPASSADRRCAFEDYWAYLLVRDGDLQEEAQSLEHLESAPACVGLSSRWPHGRRSAFPSTPA
jgi:hypothetical protein